MAFTLEHLKALYREGDLREADFDEVIDKLRQEIRDFEQEVA